MSKTIRILYVEDASPDAERVHRELRRSSLHCEITHTETLTGAMQQLSALTFDVILLDLQLPDSTGTETFDTIYAAAYGVPIVVLTSTAEQETLGAMLVGRGAQDFLTKDELEFRTLARVLAYALERTRLLRELEKARRQAEYNREQVELERLARDLG